MEPQLRERQERRDGAADAGRIQQWTRRALQLLDGREILVRFVISDITRDSCRFEQAFSADGGKIWEVNWIAVDTRDK